MKRILILFILILVSGCCKHEPDIMVMLEAQDQPQELIIIKEPTPILTDFDTYEAYVENYELYNSESVSKYKEPDIRTADLDDLALQLRGSSVEQTVFFVQTFVSGLDYEFYWYPQNVEITSKTMRGDCTDQALLAVELLRLNGIYAKPVHGFVNETVLHDWVEVLYPNPNIKGVSWQPLDNSSIIKIGDGVW